MNRETRMILAVYDTVILPDVDYRLNIGEISSEEKSRIKIDQNRAVILPTRTLKDHPQLEPEDFYPLGTAADIIDITENQMGTFLHMQQSAVTQVVSNTERRKIGANGGLGYRSMMDGADISLLDSMIIAHWLCAETKAEKKKQQAYY